MNEVRVSCPNCHQPVAVPVRIVGATLISTATEPPVLAASAEGQIYHRCDAPEIPPATKVNGL